MRDVGLADRFDLTKSPVLLSGTQALVRLLLEQQARDQAMGLQTAGLVTGYRGSPLGALDFQLTRAQPELDAARILFQPALNEEIAVTALWGTQMAGLHGEGKHDGVFGLWYGKGPGVDRSGDAFRHANMAGTDPKGGILVAMGDDHTGESSTTLHQSEPALIDALIPILVPSSVQEILDYGILGYAMSRLTGNWVGIKCVKDTVESTSTAVCTLERLQPVLPEVEMPEGGLNIRIWDTPVEREARLIDYRREAARVFATANGLNRRIHGAPGARIGLVAAGKSWLDLLEALTILGLETTDCERLGIATCKVGMTWPLEIESMRKFLAGMEQVIVVEEKRKIIETQMKEAFFNMPRRPVIIGHRDEGGQVLLTEKYELNPMLVARAIGGILHERGIPVPGLERVTRTLEITESATPPNLLDRVPYFCAGCPHNTSTRIPEGSRAYAGIGCHYMVQWMDRDTLGFTHMGGEGANWIGEAPFSTREHVYQNIGDGTYNHSGLMTIRAAVAAGATITFKILYNDAVAMTGGQTNDGSLTPQRLVRELHAIGVEHIACVHDGRESEFVRNMPRFVSVHERADLDYVQRTLETRKGVSALVYCQTCAAEKRRRRKRGAFAEAPERVFINPDICEGCGDCSRQSNCLAITPVMTELGIKRAIDQSSCNIDLRCLDGFCPSFVTLEGAALHRSGISRQEITELPEPCIRPLDRNCGIVIAGIGGTGVITIGAVLSMAAHLDGLGCGMIEMAGLAQKGGAVVVHCRIAHHQDHIAAIRITDGNAHCLIAADQVLAARAEILALVQAGQTGAIVNTAPIVTHEFTLDPDSAFPAEELLDRLTATLGTKGASYFDANEAARAALGDTIYSNMILFGAAWQHGDIPVSLNAITRAIELNGTKAAENTHAFTVGRMIAAGQGDHLIKANSSATKDPVERQQYRASHLERYQGRDLAARYTAWVGKFAGTRFHEDVLVSYHRVLAIKDEYEVARLHLDTAVQVRETFAPGFRMAYHLAPPLLGFLRRNGRPAKLRFGAWIHPLFVLLARCRVLRGTPFDPFRYSSERRAQYALRQTYREDMEFLLAHPPGDAAMPTAIELARLPQSIRGFGPIWMTSYHAAMQRRHELLQTLDTNQ